MNRRNLIALVVLALGAAGSSWAANDPHACQTLGKHGRKAEAHACFESLVNSNSDYLRAEGYWGLEQYEQANQEFRIATARPDSDPMEKVRWGMLLHERFNDSDAAGLFQEALQRDPKNAQAYLGLATVSADAFDGKAEQYAAQALALDPKLVEGHEFAANLALENGDSQGAIAQADEALALSPDALDAMAIHAAVQLLADKSGDEWFARIQKINPGYGEAYARVAHHLELNYRFEDAILYYRKAIALDPQLWPARSQLGIELMRMGQETEPFQQLEMCYNNGYRDAATVNSLRLLDSYKHFVTFKEPGVILRFDRSEADLLHPYFAAEMQQILRTYSQKYKMTLTAPVQVEVYPNHEDFAVRTTGMPGLGALGVTFGQVIAMDSPSARKPGDFNWGSTLWHEMSHVYILSLTNHRVPRWFTEGLAVHEETQHSAEWGDRVSPDILAAIRDKKLLPVAKLDHGFVFPDYPAQVVVSYFEAGSICDFIHSRWGEEKLLDMAHSFGQLKTTPQVMQTDLGVSADEFDKQYLQWVNQRYGAEAANLDRFRKEMGQMTDAASRNQYDAVIQLGNEVLRLYPEYIGDGSAYEMVAAADLGKGDKKAATAVLTQYEKIGGQEPSMLKKLASLEEESGQEKEAAATLNRINYIYPVHDEALHRQLGDLWLAQGNYAGAVREYGAVVALNPLDKAGAHFSLARAYYAAGQKDKAEESVLAALEAAPGYRPAQQLLLQIEHPEQKDAPKTN